MGEFRFSSARERADIGAFLARVVRLDAAALVRLRVTDRRMATYVWLPFGVLVSRVAAGDYEPGDVTVRAADLLAALADTPEHARLLLPAARDADWRGALPPVRGWQPLDTVPINVVDSLVRAGAEALRSVDRRATATVGERLLDQEALTVSDGARSVAFPLRVLSAAWRMGFLGGDRAVGQQVVVSVSGRWSRLAAPYGTAYHRVAPALSLQPR